MDQLKSKPIEKMPLPGDKPIRKKNLKNSDFFVVKEKKNK